MELREKKDEKMEKTRGNSSANHQTLEDHPTTKRNGSDPDPNLNPDLDTNLVSVTPTPCSYSRLQATSPRRVRYKECQRNHAASSGGHVIDGCGEFMSSGEEGTAGFLLCAACDCHRSFHRKEIDGLFVMNFNSFGHSQRPFVSRHVSPIMMSFGGQAESSTEELSKLHQSLSGNGTDEFQYNLKKRVRTKFNEEQKEKMKEFAEKIGWRITKQEDEEVNRFCREINVKRQVFKVWMHNSKQAAKKKDM